jgi:hypothetical protein
MNKTDWKYYSSDHAGVREYKGIRYQRSHMPEAGGHVFQLEVAPFGVTWIEPFTTERECQAFIDGYLLRDSRKAEV